MLKSIWEKGNECRQLDQDLRVDKVSGLNLDPGKIADITTKLQSKKSEIANDLETLRKLQLSSNSDESQDSLSMVNEFISHGEFKPVLTENVSGIERLLEMNLVAKEAIQKEKNGKIIAVIGASHLTSCYSEALPGVAELTKTPAIEIYKDKASEVKSQEMFKNRYGQNSTIGCGTRTASENKRNL